MQNFWLLFMTLSAMVLPIVPYELAVYGAKHNKKHNK